MAVSPRMGKWRYIEPYPKAVPRKLEISGFFKCFFTYSSGVILLSRAQGYFIENVNNL
jgi:hypothetical protein